jgi:predicted AAA+ superfamily ATPase
MRTIYPRFFKTPPANYFLFGPRGTGKSTLLKLLYPEALVVDLLLPDVYRNYLTRPERLIEIVRGNPEKRIIVIDEVQKVPELLSVVHSLTEQDKSRQFILTGSSARQLRRGGVDLLAGRLLLRTLHPFMLAEISDNISFDKVLKHGLLPIVIDSTNPNDVLEAYITHYIREEVQIESI